MSIFNDLWDYVLSGSSTPWFRVAGTASIAGGVLAMGNAAAVDRLGVTGSSVVEADITFVSGGGTCGFSPLGGATTGPGVALKSGLIQMGSVNYPSTATLAAFGTLNQTALALVGGLNTVRCKWFLKATAHTLAARFFYNGIEYVSGFVASAFSTWSTINFYSQPLNVTANVGPLTITYGLSDAQVQTLYDGKIGMGAPSITKPTALGTGLLNPRGSGALVIPRLALAGVGFVPARGQGAASISIPTLAGVGNRIGPRSQFFPDATGKISHARILRGYRAYDEAALFHNLMKEAT